MTRIEGVDGDTGGDGGGGNVGGGVSGGGRGTTEVDESSTWKLSCVAEPKPPSLSTATTRTVCNPTVEKAWETANPETLVTDWSKIPSLSQSIWNVNGAV